jgi:hypothetical protein
MPASYVYGQVSLDFMLEGKKEKTTVKYRYLKDGNTVEYLSIEYSSEMLKEKIEGSPAMRQKIDQYVKTMLSRRNQGLS